MSEQIGEWTIRMKLAWRLRQRWETSVNGIANWIAWRLPKRVAYHSAIRVACHSTVGEYSSQIVPDLGAMTAIQQWHKDHKLSY